MLTEPLPDCLVIVTCPFTVMRFNIYYLGLPGGENFPYRPSLRINTEYRDLRTVSEAESWVQNTKSV